MPRRNGGIEWQKTPQQAVDEILDAHIRVIEAGIYGLFQRYSAVYHNTMVGGAPWTDRTGNARQGLWTGVEHEPGRMTTMTLGHGVEYGFWLEVRWSGRYAIVVPTWDQAGVQLFATVVGWFR